MMTDGEKLIRRAIAAHSSQRGEATTRAPTVAPKPDPKPAAKPSRFSHLNGQNFEAVQAIALRASQPAPEPEQPIASLVASIIGHTNAPRGRR
jgi:hypothetical protein